MENPYLEKIASMNERHRYVEDPNRILKMKNPAATIKYDGANFFLKYDTSGVPSFVSRKLSVSGGVIDRTEKVPHLAKVLPSQAGKTFNVELIHTGLNPAAKESPSRLSGMLNSLAPKAVATQAVEGPVRAAIFDVIDPNVTSFLDKRKQILDLQRDFGDEALVFAPELHVGHDAVQALISSTKKDKREGIIAVDLSAEESKNPRVKVKHKNSYNLKVVGILREYDKNGMPKESAGAVRVQDATGRDLGNVGIGFTKETRKDIWDNQGLWMNKLIKVQAMDSTASKLRHAVYDGDADGSCDVVPL